MTGELSHSFDFLSITSVIKEILSIARERGVNFLVFGGLDENGSFIPVSSDVDVLCRTQRDVSLFLSAIYEVVSSTTTEKVIRVHFHQRGFFLVISHEEKNVYAFDVTTALGVEHLTFLESEVAFALLEQGIDVRTLVRGIKHLNNIKFYWPQLPPKLYCLKTCQVKQIDKKWAWLRKIARTLKGFISARGGVWAVIVEEGTSLMAEKVLGEVKKAWDGQRNVLPVFVYWGVPPFKRNRNASGFREAWKENNRNVGMGGWFWVFKYWLGYILLVRPLLVRGGVILEAISFEDLQERVHRFSRWWLPKPDMFVVLCGTMRCVDRSVPQKLFNGTVPIYEICEDDVHAAVLRLSEVLLKRYLN